MILVSLRDCGLTHVQVVLDSESFSVLNLLLLILESLTNMLEILGKIGFYPPIDDCSVDEALEYLLEIRIMVGPGFILAGLGVASCVNN